MSAIDILVKTNELPYSDQVNAAGLIKTLNHQPKG